MKANLTSTLTPFFEKGTGFSLRPIAVGLGLMVMLSSCTGPMPLPPVTIAPQPLPEHNSAPTVTTGPIDWRDAPISAGAWSWDGAGGVSRARYGLQGAQPLAHITCQGGTITILLTGHTGAETTLFALSTATKAWQATARTVPGGYSVSLGAGDRVWDAVALTRGRFALELAGRAMLVLPADPAISRVVEDCR